MMKLQIYLKETATQVFYYQYFEIFKNSNFEEQLRTGVSVLAYFEFHRIMFMSSKSYYPGTSKNSMGFSKLSRSYTKTKLAIDIPQPCPLYVQDKTYAFFLF